MFYSINKPLLLIIALIVGIFFTYNSLNFKLDASSDTLILQNDDDFKFFNYYNEIFPNKNFLVLAVKSNNKIDQEFIKSINKIKPVIKLKAEILQIKKLYKNEFVGYNQTFCSHKNMVIAIIGIGYADGIFRQLSNKGYVFYKNIKFRIIGRISMDSITIDITNHKYALKNGMFLEIINYKYDIEKFATMSGTISNEILTSISSRVKRIYI